MLCFEQWVSIGYLLAYVVDMCTRVHVLSIGILTRTCTDDIKTFYYFCWLFKPHSMPHYILWHMYLFMYVQYIHMCNDPPNQGMA